MTGHSRDPEPRARPEPVAPAPRQARRPEADFEDAERDRVEIPAFLRRQAN